MSLKPVFKRSGTPLLWAWMTALVASMLLFPAAGIWLYVVFLCLSAPLVALWIHGAVTRRELAGGGFLIVVLAFAAVGAYALATRGSFIFPSGSAPVQEGATASAAGR